MARIQSEIIIIGGGIAGTATACYLAQDGHEVILLEQNELASEASGLNAGTIWATGWSNTPDLVSTLNFGSLEIFKILQLDLGYDIEFRQSGSLQAIQTAEQYAFAQREAHNLAAAGHRVELLSAREARSIEPELSPHILGCLYYPYGGNANPVKTVQALAMLAQRHGASILTHHTVTGITHLDEGSYEVITPPATFKARTLVLAAGPWCRDLGAMLGLSIPVYPVRGQMWATAPQPPRIFHSIGALESHFYWHTHPYSDEQTPLELTHRQGQRLTRHLYGRQTREGEIIFGGDRQVNVPKIPEQAGIEVNHAHALELFPFLKDLPIVRTWAGWMPFTRDLHPLIGKIPRFDNLYLLTGLSSSGFEKGMMAGKLLAEFMHEGIADPILSEADPGGSIGFL
ncbi:MAG TPA: FAD-dependent oxidoreductase [Ktedonobacteraceae bacterium]|nr:FAD-dependent oxidoreductase [Ktedonobacteraceae bacterium]